VERGWKEKETRKNEINADLPGRFLFWRLVRIKETLPPSAGAHPSRDDFVRTVLLPFLLFVVLIPRLPLLSRTLPRLNRFRTITRRFRFAFGSVDRDEAEGIGTVV